MQLFLWIGMDLSTSLEAFLEQDILTKNFHFLGFIPQEHLWLLLPPLCFGSFLSGSGDNIPFFHGDKVIFPIWVPLGDPTNTDTNSPQIQAWSSPNNNLQKLSSVLPPLNCWADCFQFLLQRQFFILKVPFKKSWWDYNINKLYVRNPFAEEIICHKSWKIW